MRTDRLLTLADFLETVPPEQFSMNVWSCNTAACACGWAARIPEFQKAGFRMARSVWWTLVPAFLNYIDWEAVDAFFELDGDDSYRLFSATRYADGVKPGVVAAAIRQFVTGRTAA